TVKVEDKAGNTNYSAPLTVVIDTQIAIDGVELVNDSGVKGDNTGKSPRYYQLQAINKTIEAVSAGQDRVLLVMATGTGKTYTAF
ncbi:DEAD/DEAH box helicase family protein, partial [Salmonella enterica subsp. enterica serovar Lubbock]|nr:DEAD/DEAH box helicase family protein [Salmonella enterica subsp. enterica serovar Lubbock]